jgi:hypothetical protein
MTDLARALRRLSFSLPRNHPLHPAIDALHTHLMEASKCA